MAENNSKIINISLAVAGAMVLIWIIYMRNSKPDNSILAPIIIGIIVIIAFIVSSFGKSISEKLKALGSNLEKTLTDKEVDEMAYRFIEGTSENKFKDGMFRNIKRIEERRSRGVEGDEIYAVLVRLSHPITFGENQEDGLWIVINATHPNVMPSILREDTEKLEEEMNFKSKKYRDPTTTEETVRNESIGFESHRRTVSPTAEPKEKEEEAL